MTPDWNNSDARLQEPILGLEPRADEPLWLEDEDDRRDDARHQRLRRPVLEADLQERRRSGRVPGLRLNSWERATLYRRLKARALCGLSWATYRRSLGSTEQRLLASRGCGWRGCPRCGETAQSYHHERLGGHWRHFLTLTLPPDRPVADWWRVASGLIRRWCHWLRREVREGRATLCDGPTGPSPRLEYSWTVEVQDGGSASRRRRSKHVPKQTGNPHWHLLSNLAWIDYTRAREAWQRIAGVELAWIHGSRIRTEAGVRWYVSEYVTKGRLPVEVLAILGKGRQWQSTTKRRLSDEPGWVAEAPVAPSVALVATEVPGFLVQGNGWEVSWASPGRAVLWERSRSGQDVREGLKALLVAKMIDVQLARDDERDRGILQTVESYRRGLPTDGLVREGEGYDG